MFTKLESTGTSMLVKIIVVESYGPHLHNRCLNGKWSHSCSGGPGTVGPGTVDRCLNFDDDKNGICYMDTALNSDSGCWPYWVPVVMKEKTEDGMCISGRNECWSYV